MIVEVRHASFLLDHLPPQMHLVITTREDPSLPLARYRARGQLTELRAADLRFTPDEAAEFLNQMMSLNLSAEDIAALETRTEGWIAGSAIGGDALSMQGREDTASFIQAFTGSGTVRVLCWTTWPKRFFSTSLNISAASYCKLPFSTGYCAPLCNAVTEREDGKEMLDTLERSNLFLIPLDDQAPVVSLSSPFRRSSANSLDGGAT